MCEISYALKRNHSNKQQTNKTTPSDIFQLKWGICPISVYFETSSTQFSVFNISSKFFWTTFRPKFVKNSWRSVFFLISVENLRSKRTFLMHNSLKSDQWFKNNYNLSEWNLSFAYFVVCMIDSFVYSLNNIHLIAFDTHVLWPWKSESE